MRPRRPEKKPREAGLAPRPLEALPPPGPRRVLNPILPWAAALGLARRSRGRARARPRLAVSWETIGKRHVGRFPQAGGAGSTGQPEADKRHMSHVRSVRTRRPPPRDLLVAPK